MAKIIKRIEFIHEVDEEANTVNIKRTYNGFTTYEILGVLTFEKARFHDWLHSADELVSVERQESEVKSDEPAEQS